MQSGGEEEIRQQGCGPAARRSSGGGDAVWRRTRRTLAERIDFVFFFIENDTAWSGICLRWYSSVNNFKPYVLTPKTLRF
jgi:hypothetical protein